MIITPNKAIWRTTAKIVLGAQLFQMFSIPAYSVVSSGGEKELKSTVANYTESHIIRNAETLLNQYGTSQIKTHFDIDDSKFDDSSIDMLFALKNDNDRVSVGGEYFRDYLRFTTNAYIGLNGRHDSSLTWTENNTIILLEEKPSDGFDLTLNTYLPDYPQLGLKLGYEQYFGLK